MLKKKGPSIPKLKIAGFWGFGNGQSVKILKNVYFAVCFWFLFDLRTLINAALAGSSSRMNSSERSSLGLRIWYALASHQVTHDHFICRGGVGIVAILHFDGRIADGRFNGATDLGICLRTGNQQNQQGNGASQVAAARHGGLQKMGLHSR
jgi:hypothetical protein